MLKDFFCLKTQNALRTSFTAVRLLLHSGVRMRADYQVSRTAVTNPKRQMARKPSDLVKLVRYVR